MADHGYSTRKLVGGLNSPGQIAASPTTGMLYLSSFADGPGNPPQDIFQMTRDGVATQFTAPLADPDSIAVRGNGKVYVGSSPGRVTEIDPITGAQVIFIEDQRLGNVDGLGFLANGDLLVAPWDQGLLWRVDMTTKEISLFHDLRDRQVNALTGIAVHPQDGRVWVSAPEQGKVYALTAGGDLIGDYFAKGMTYPCALAIDRSLASGNVLFVADYKGGVIWRLPLDASGITVSPSQRLVKGISPHVGGVTVDGQGALYFTQTQANSPGQVWLVSPMRSAVRGTPTRGSRIHIDMSSRADANRYWAMLFSLGRSGFALPDGRQVSLDPTFLRLGGVGLMNGAGEASLALDIPSDPAISNISFYGVYFTVSGSAGFDGVSDVITVSVE
jgi:sugar lactone lactonase YvrE